MNAPPAVAHSATFFGVIGAIGSMASAVLPIVQILAGLAACIASLYAVVWYRAKLRGDSPDV